MITTAQMYWIVTLDSLVHLMVALVCIGIVVTIGGIAYVAETGGSKRVPIVAGALSLAAMVALSLIPTTKQAAAIIVVPRLVNSEKVQTVGNRLYDLAVEWMDGLKPEKEAK